MGTSTSPLRILSSGSRPCGVFLQGSKRAYISLSCLLILVFVCVFVGLGIVMLRARQEPLTERSRQMADKVIADILAYKARWNHYPQCLKPIASSSYHW